VGKRWWRGRSRPAPKFRLLNPARILHSLCRPCQVHLPEKLLYESPDIFIINRPPSLNGNA